MEQNGSNWSEQDLRTALANVEGVVSSSEWEFLVENLGIRCDVYDGWETDEDVQADLLEDLARQLRAVRKLRSPENKNAIPPVGRSKNKAVSYEPTSGDEIRSAAVGHYYTSCFDVHPDVIAIREYVPGSGTMSNGDAGKFLVNPLNWMMDAPDATALGLSLIEDSADLEDFRYYTQGGGQGEFPPQPFVEYLLVVHSKGIRASVSHYLFHRIEFTVLPTTPYAQVVFPNKSRSIWDFFGHHPRQQDLFPEGNTRDDAERPAFCFVESSLGRCIAVAQDLANLFDLDVRDVLLYLLTGYLHTPSLAVVTSTEIPTFNIGRQITDVPTCGPIHLVIQPWMRPDDVRALYLRLQRTVRDDRELRPIKNIELFYFVNQRIRDDRSGQFTRDNRVSWKALHEAWKNAPPEFRKEGKPYPSPVTFRTAYLDLKNALFPSTLGNNRRTKKATDDFAKTVE